MDVNACVLQGDRLYESKRYQEASEIYRGIVTAVPEHLVANIRLARCFAQLGDHVQAHRFFKAAFNINFGSLVALANLLNYEDIAPEDPRLANLKKGVRDQSLSKEHRALGCFLLGRIFLSAHQDKDAYAWYALGNQLEFESQADTPSQNSASVSSPIKPQDFERQFGAPQRTLSNCPALVITGLPRSGKTLVEHLLSDSDEIAPQGELALVYESLLACEERHGKDQSNPRETLPQLLTDSYRKSQADSERSLAKYVTDTSPVNFWYLGALGYAHPSAPIIICKRDTLDLGVSIYFTHFAIGQRYSYQQESLGRYMAHAEKTIRTWQLTLPNPLLVVSYEELVRDPIAMKERLFSFLGIEVKPFRRIAGKGFSNRLHISETLPGIGAIQTDLIGIGTRFETEFEAMMRAYTEAMKSH